MSTIETGAGGLANRKPLDRRSIWIAVRQSRAAYLLLLPFIVHFVVVVAYPLAYSIYLSFFEAGLGLAPEYVGLQNFRELLADERFRQALGNTFYFAFFAVIGETVLPLALALVMNTSLRFRALFRTAYFLPVITSWVVVSIIWGVLLSREGVVNTVLSAVGFAEQPLLADARQAMWIIILLSVWKNLGYYMVIYLAGLQGVPQDLYDAAAIDGAGTWRSPAFDPSSTSLPASRRSARCSSSPSRCL